MRRNPNWARDELILALDLYFRVNPLHTSRSHPEIIQLSQLLNDLPIHAKSEQQQTFRDPAGVYMKLCNFLRFDPDYHGTGLSAGSKLDENIWREFYPDRQRLSETAAAIRRNHKYLPRPRSMAEELQRIDEGEEFPEGQILLRLHTLRERNSSAVRRKKTQILKQTGKLACEACGFDFGEFYGKLGVGFAECHHTVPLSYVNQRKIMRMSDLTIVCANCHRILHRIRPWLQVKQLKDLIGK
jgi:5-methylcytosine-specific restriction protein A